MSIPGNLKFTGRVTWEEVANERKSIELSFGHLITFTRRTTRKKIANEREAIKLSLSHAIPLTW